MYTISHYQYQTKKQNKNAILTGSDTIIALNAIIFTKRTPVFIAYYLQIGLFQTTGVYHPVCYPHVNILFDPPRAAAYHHQGDISY